MGARPAFWGVLAAAALLLLARMDGVPLLDPDESRFARTSVEMLRTHDLVVPTYNAEPRLTKPPLVHWIQSALFRAFGIAEWSARLHALLATLGSTVLVAWVARRRYGDEAAAWAAAVFVTMPLVAAAGRVGTLDALLAVHVLAVVALDLASADEGRGDYRAVSIGGLTGLAFLAKGPVGVILPLLIVLAGRTAAGRDTVRSPRALLLGAAAWSVVVLPWGLAFVRRVGWETLLATLRTEVLDRYFAGTAHVEPYWFYGKVIAVAFLPWLVPLLAAIGRAWQLRSSAVSLTARYAAGGLLAGIVFFSLSKGKVASYLLPLAPLAALLVTWELGREIEDPDRRGLVPTLLAASLAATSLLLGLLSLRVEGGAEVAAVVGALAYGCGSVPACWGALRNRPRLVYASAGGAAWLFLFAVAILALPELGRSRSAAPLVEQVRELRRARAVVTVAMQAPSLGFYLDRPTEVIDLEDLSRRLDEPDRPVVVFADVDLPWVAPEVLGRLREVGRHAKLRAYVEAQDPPDGGG